MGHPRRRNEPQDKKIPPVKTPAALPYPTLFSTYAWLIPLLFALIVNANVLRNGFVWDDKGFFVDASHQALNRDGPGLSPVVYFRPLIGWSYHLDRAIWDLNPFGAHLTVYLAHALTTLLIYLNTASLLRLYRKEESIALLTASLFAVHPIHTEAVAWIAGRSDVFMALFMMTALYAYLRYRRHPSSRAMIPLFILGSLFGLLSKETAIPFLLVFPALDILFHRSGFIRWRGMKDPLAWVWGMALISFILYRLSNVEMPSAHRAAGTTTGNEIMAVFLALGYYLRLLFIPHPLNLFVAELPKGGPALFYITLGLGGMALLIWTVLRWNRTLFSVGAVWFAAGITAPLVVPLVQVAITPVAERYTYLASGGFLLMVSVGVFEGWRWVQSRVTTVLDTRWMIGSLLLITGLFSFLTVERNSVWRDEVILWTDTIQKSPRAVLPHNNLGVVYKDQNRFEDALREFQTALTLDPNYFQAHYNMGIIYEKRKQFDEAIQEYQTTLKLKPGYTRAHNNLGAVYKDLGRLEDAEAEFQAALKIQPDLPTTHYNRGTTLSGQGRMDDAIGEYKAAIRLDPAYQNAHYNLGLAYANQGRFQEAIVEFLTVVRLKPDDAAAHAVLGDIYKDQGQPREAMDQYQAALKLDPNQAEIHYNLGVLYGRDGRWEDAKKEYQQALQLKPDFPAAREALLSLPKK